MTRHKISLILLVVLLCLLSYSNASKKNKIKLRDVQVITLHHGQWTTGRRTRPVPQLQCIGGTNRCKFLPQVVQCYNRGFNGEEIQWECKADLNKNLRFNKIDVTCEGYDFPEDDYILVGSCGLEYSIDTVDGTIPFPEPHFNKPHPNNLPKRPKKKDEPGFGTVLVLGIIASFMYLIYKNCIEPLDESRRRRRASPSPSAPPPPPGFMPGFAPPDDPPCSTSQSTSQQTSQNSGFWSGATWGGLAGYLLGSYNNRTNQGHSQEYEYEEPLHRQHRTPSSSSTSSSWSSWSFWPGSDVRQRNRREERNQTPPTTTMSDDATSDESRTASGFGGTSRR